MKTLILKLLNLFALLGSIAWLSINPDWEPLVTSIVLFATLVSIESITINKVNERDIDLFDKFLIDFPSSSRSVKFLETQDIAAPFESKALYDLDNFIYKWDSADYEFVHPKMEKKRKLLINKSKTFRYELSLNTYPSDIGDDFYTMGFNDIETRKHLLDKRDELNTMASEIFEVHQELIRLGKKILINKPENSENTNQA